MKKEYKNNWDTPSTRKAFKWHTIIFAVGIFLLWVMWWVGIKSDHVLRQKNYTHFPWPVWPAVIWAIILRYHYLAVYGKRKSLPEDIVKNKNRR